MKLQGEHTFDAPRATVWRALNDPEILARTLPNCERLEETEENVFEGAMNIKVGPVSGLFQGKVALTDLQPNEGYHMEIDGKGAPGFVKGKGNVSLEDAEDGGTKLTYDLDAQVGGRIAGVGQRLLDSSARVISRQALEGLEAQVDALHQSETRGEGAAPPPAPEAPSQGEMAGRFAKGLYEEMVPAPWRPVVIAGAVVVVLGVIFLIVRACGG